MVKIRLKRLGAKRNPIYRIIVIDSREKREGKAITELGYYNPKKKELKFNKAEAQAWISKGAQPSETVAYLIKNSDETGVLVKKAEPTEQKLSKKAKAKLEAEEKAKAEAAAKAAEAKTEEEAAA
jgi:small subunit ribosomal protein S16